MAFRGMSLPDLMSFDGVALSRQDQRLSSLPIVASERDRVVAQAELRESTKHVWIEPLGAKTSRREAASNAHGGLCSIVMVMVISYGIKYQKVKFLNELTS